MQNTTHYNLMKAEGTDTVNLLTQCYPNFDTIDAAMFANKQGSIGTATEVTTGTVHAITRNNADSDIFRFTATSAWTAGDTMTLDGVGVTVHLADGTTPATGAYIIGAEVLGVVNGSLVTLFLSSAIQSYVSSFNSRTGAVTPASSDYDASMIDYDNTVSGLNSTDVQGAIDELSGNIYSIWTNTDSTQAFPAQNVNFSDGDFRFYIMDFKYNKNGNNHICSVFRKGNDTIVNTFVQASASVAAVPQRIISYINDTTINIGDCSLMAITSGNVSSSINNDIIIPVEIFGVK